MILALDSSTALAGLALYGPEGIAAEFSWLSHRDQTVQILPLAQKMLDLQKLTPQALTGVAVAIGPGSFNGLRVAVSAAKGMALALDLPIYGLSSLDIIAAGQAYLDGELCALVEAGRGRFGAAFYRVGQGRWQRESDDLNLDVAELIEKLSQKPRTLVAGELKTAQRDELIAKLPDKVVVLSPAIGLRRAALLAELAWQRQQSGDKGDDLTNLQPIYLHQG